MQYMKDKNQKSRMWKIVLKDGKFDKMVLVAKGFNVANGTAIKGGYVYITESVMEEDSHPLTSAVMRFKLDEENVTLKTPLKEDPHIIATFKSAARIGASARMASPSTARATCSSGSSARARSGRSPSMPMAR